MKKTLITLFALTGIASATTSITLPEASDFTWVKGADSRADDTYVISRADLKAGNIENFAEVVAKANKDLTGWFGGTGQGHEANHDGGGELTMQSQNSFSFVSRPAYNGHYVVLGVNLTETAKSITLTFNTDNTVGYSIWSYNAETSEATQLTDYVTTSTGKVTNEYNTAVVNPSQLFVVWTTRGHNEGGVGGGTTINISKIALSYEAAANVPATPAVPEPATATLSLLALAGLAARRRRK